MMKKERQRFIPDRVNKEGRIVTEELVIELGLAEDTIRKDFQYLSANGLVQRVHGDFLRLGGTGIIADRAPLPGQCRPAPWIN